MMHRHDSTTAAAALALVTEISLLANGGPARSVLICDDRRTVALALSQMLQILPSLVDIAWVQDAFELADAYATNAADLVLIGVHHGSRLGEEAIGLMVGLNPTAAIIVIGSVVDAEGLAAAFVRGARSSSPRPFSSRCPHRGRGRPLGRAPKGAGSRVPREGNIPGVATVLVADSASTRTRSQSNNPRGARDARPHRPIETEQECRERHFCSDSQLEVLMAAEARR